MINYPHAYYLRFFLQKNINVVVWNYRGYGRSKVIKGCYNEPSPTNIVQDSEAVFKYCRNVLGLRGKIGVYGRSMGGVGASHLTEFADMVIIDRTFSNLYDFAGFRYYGEIARLIFKISTCGWRTRNDIDFITRGLSSSARDQNLNALLGLTRNVTYQTNKISPSDLSSLHRSDSQVEIDGNGN